MRMMRFDYDISHTLGKEIFLADALSRPPQEHSGEGLSENSESVEDFTIAIVGALFDKGEGQEDLIRSYGLDRASGLCKQYIGSKWPPQEETNGGDRTPIRQ